MIDRQVLAVLRRIESHKPYLRGTLATLGFDQKGIAYDRKERQHGQSKFSLRDLFGLALDGILSQSTVPLRLATYTGLFVSLLTLFAVIGYSVGRFVLRRDWPAGFATTTILGLLSLSLNALFLGIIGEYTGRIYHQARRGPLTIVEKRIDRAPGRRPPFGVGSVFLADADDGETSGGEAVGARSDQV